MKSLTRGMMTNIKQFCISMKGIINQNVFDFKSYFPKLEVFSENGFRKILLNLISIRMLNKILLTIPSMIIIYAFMCLLVSLVGILRRIYAPVFLEVVCSAPDDQSMKFKNPVLRIAIAPRRRRGSV